MTRLHRALLGASLALATAAPSSGQQQHVKGPPTPPGSVVSGRVFGITEGGDLKPARLASVYLIFKGSERTDPQSASKDGTAGRAFNDAVLDNFLKAEKSISKMLSDFAAEHPRGGEFNQVLACRQKLLALDQSIRDTTEWVLTNKKPKQLLFADADEEGYFRINKVPAGRYRVEARGQAGADDASWSADIIVGQGEGVSVKLASPGLACPVVTPSELRPLPSVCHSLSTSTP